MRRTACLNLAWKAESGTIFMSTVERPIIHYTIWPRCIKKSDSFGYMVYFEQINYDDDDDRKTFTVLCAKQVEANICTLHSAHVQ